MFELHGIDVEQVLLLSGLDTDIQGTFSLGCGELPGKIVVRNKSFS